VKREQLKFVISSESCNLKECFRCRSGWKSFETRHHRGWESRIWPSRRHNTMHFPRVGLFGIAALIRWYIPSKAKYWRETDSIQVPWGKDEKNFEKRVKQYVKLLKGKRLKSVLSCGNQRGSHALCTFHAVGQHRFWLGQMGWGRWLACKFYSLSLWPGWDRGLRFIKDVDEMISIDPSWNTDQGVQQLCEYLGGKPKCVMKVNVGGIPHGCTIDRSGFFW
jgi:hypothetical protein